MSLRLKTIVLFALPISAAIAACGGRDVGDLFDPTSATNDSGTQFDAPLTADSEPPLPPFDGAAPDASVDLDTGTPPVRDTGIADTGIADSGRDSPRVIDDSNGTLCGSAANPTYCDNATQFCCATRQAQVATFTSFRCVANGTACNGILEADFRCDGTEDCAAREVCCGAYIAMSGRRVETLDSTKCLATNACKNTINATFVEAGVSYPERHVLAPMCKLGAVPDECGARTCGVSLAPIYGFCQ